MPIDDIDQVFAVRDNTKTRAVADSGFRNYKEDFKPEYMALDDNILGYMPVVGDVLQGAEAVRNIKK